MELPKPSTSSSSRATASYDIEPKKIIYCEDVYFEVNSDDYYHMKCDISPQPTNQAPLPFNYSRTVEASNGGIPPNLDYFTDDQLKYELFEIYGEMDETSDRFRKILGNYKKQRLEQLNEWAEAETQLLSANEERGETLKYAPFGTEFIEEDEELNKYFNEDELFSFRSVADNRTTSVQPFLVPRKESKNESPTKAYSSGHKGHLQKRIDIIAIEVETVLNQSPLGITRDKLVAKCNERFRSLAKVSGNDVLHLTSATITGKLSKDVLFTKNYCKESYLVFPASLQSVLLQDPMTILWNLKHRLLAVLHLSKGIIEVNECIELCFKIFQIKRFQYRDWGFTSGVDFMEWLLNQWKTREVEVIQLNLSKKGTNNAKYYLAVMTDELRKLVEQYSLHQTGITYATQNTSNPKTDNQLKNLSKKPQSNNVKLSTSGPKSASHSQKPIGSSPWAAATVSKLPLLNYDPNAVYINPDYVQLGDVVVKMQDEMSPGHIEDCVVSKVYSPTRFYLVLKGKWKELYQLFDSLRNTWNSSLNAMWPHPKFLQKNFICMAKADCDEEGEEFYRVVILGKLDESHYKVFCIDYGDVLTVRHDLLRFLPKQYLTLEAQAIQCSIYNVAPPTNDPNGNAVWDQSTCQFTKCLFNPTDCDTPIVKVHFKQRVYGKGVWLVKVSSPPTSMDFGEDIMKFVNSTQKCK